MTSIVYISLGLSALVLATILIINRQWKQGLKGISDAEDQVNLIRRQRIATFLHTLTLLFLIIALINVGKEQESSLIQEPADTAGLVFLLDVSQSMQDKATQEWCQDQINRIYDTWETQVDMAGIAFGGQSDLLFTSGENPRFNYNSSVIQASATDIQQALKKAGASLLHTKHKKIVLLSDGKTSAGDALKEAYLLGQNDITIYPMLPPGFQGLQNEIKLDSAAYPLRLPTYVNAGEPFVLELMLAKPMLSAFHNQSITGNIIIDGQRQAPFRLKIDQDKDFLSHTLKLQDPGIHHIQLGLETQPPLTFEGFTTLLQPAKVLLLESYNSGLAKVLYERNFAVDLLRESEFYLSAEELAPYNLVFLNDIPAKALLEDTELNLLDFVEEKGGGLVYNLGAVSAKPDFKERSLYPILPMKPDKAKDDGQRISLCIAIDNSGSMQLRGLDKAAKSLIRSKDNMEKVKRLSIFTFDSKEVWLTSPEPQPYSVQDIVQRLEQVQSGGGGINVNPAMQIAYQSLEKAPYKRHVLLITDLDDSQMILNSAELAAQAYQQYEITTHILAIGDYGAFRIPLQQMAEQGHGSFKEIRKAGNTIAQLNWEGKGDESIAFQDEKIQLGLNNLSPIVSGIPESLPEGKGYVPMETKEGAVEVFQIKTGDKDFSGLSHWIQSKGRVAMLNVGIENPEGWYDWPYLDKFWSQLMRWTSPLNSADPYLVQMIPKRSGIEIHFEKNDPRQSVNAPAYLFVKTIEQELRIQLYKQHDGHYYGTFTSVPGGFCTIDLMDNAGTVLQSHKVYTPGVKSSQSIAMEQMDFSADEILLKAIASASGGVFNPDQLNFEANSTIASKPTKEENVLSNYWQFFLFLALLTYGIGAYARNGINWKAALASYPRIVEILSNMLSKNK